MPIIEPLTEVKIINIDFPFVQPEDWKIDGRLATSFSTVKEMIDLAIQLGFNTISFDTNVPINAQNGELQLQVAGDTNGDKTFPQAIWDGVAYAESKGLKTILDLNIRNALNDVPIMPSNVGEHFDTSVFFNTVTQYETEIAGQANQFGVDAIRIGSFNSGYDTNDYNSNWASLINSIRSVYQGSLGYQSSLEDVNNALWGIVDEIHLAIPVVSPLKSNYTKAEIAPLYLTSYMMGNGVLSQASIFSKFESIAQKYPGKTLTLEVSFSPGQSAGHENVDIWGYVFLADPLLVNAKDQNSLVAYPEYLIDPILNQQKIAGFFEFFSNYLKDIVSGFQYFQLAPWLETHWIRDPDPQNLQGQVWQSVARAGPFLNYSPESQNIIAEYLLKDWGFSTLHYGTINNDVLNGSEVADTFFISNGNDMLSGGGGLDTVILSGTASYFTITKTTTGYTVTDKAGNGGTDTLVNIERLQFADKWVALDIDGNAGQAYRLYQAAFNRQPDLGGLGYQMRELDNGLALATVAQNFINSPEFSATYGSLDDTDFINQMYLNVLHRPAEAAGLDFYENHLEAGTMTRAAVLVGFSESPENQANVIGVIENGMEYVL